MINLLVEMKTRFFLIICKIHIQCNVDRTYLFLGVCKRYIHVNLNYSAIASIKVFKRSVVCIISRLKILWLRIKLFQLV